MVKLTESDLKDKCVDNIEVDNIIELIKWTVEDVLKYAPEDFDGLEVLKNRCVDGPRARVYMPSDMFNYYLNNRSEFEEINESVYSMTKDVKHVPSLSESVVYVDAENKDGVVYVTIKEWED